MTDTTHLGEQIGSVISLTGSVWAVSGNSQRPLTKGAPVYEGEEIVTESDSNVEIKFADDTILGQGQDSAVRLDDYVFDGEDVSLDFQMVKGVMRVVSGEIVKVNPEAFNLSTPLATIGIRGTQIMVQVDEGREFIGVDEMGAGHTVLIANAHSEVVIDKAGMFSGVDFDGSLIAPDQMPDNFISTITRAAPLTVLGDSPRNPGDSQEITPPQSYETINNQSGEYQPGFGMEYADEGEGEEELAGAGEEGEEEFELTEAEIEALLELETAGGPQAGTGDPLGQVVDLPYNPYTNETNANEGSSTAGYDQDDQQDQNSGNDAPPTDDPTPPPDDDTPPPADPPADPPTADPPETPPVEDPPADDYPRGDYPPPTAPPMAEDATAEQPQDEENTPVSYNVITSGDASGDGATLLTAELPEDSTYEGKVTITPAGDITYTPDEGETGTVVIDYTVSDLDGETASAQLSIELAEDSEPTLSTTNAVGVETPEMLTASGTITTDFGADVSGSSVALYADNAEWFELSSTLMEKDGLWAIELTDTGYEYTQFEALTGASGTAPGETLTVNVGVTATDGDGSSVNGAFTISVTDDDPSASDVLLTQSVENTDIEYNVLTGGMASTGLFGGTLVDAMLADSGSTGTLSHEETGVITYTPGPGEYGTVVIDYTIEDSDGDPASAQLFIELTDDSEPVITTSSTSGDETSGMVTTTGTLNVDFGNDATNAEYILSATDATWTSENGTGTLADNKGNWTIEVVDDEYTFTQLKPFSHSDNTTPNDLFAVAVLVTATDGDNTVKTGNFTITVADDGPTANLITLTQENEGDLIYHNVFVEEDALPGTDGAPLTNAVLTPGSDYSGTISFDDYGDITYNPESGEIGTVAIDYTVTDNDGDTATAQMTIELAKPDQGDMEAPPSDEMPPPPLDGFQGWHVDFGSDGNDLMNAENGKNALFGYAGDDTLSGGNAKDFLVGGSDNDQLTGGNGTDSLFGESGDDLLVGGNSNDHLMGGAGSDTFVFTSPNDGTDTIFDFNTAEDYIALYEATFNISSEFVTVDATSYDGELAHTGSETSIVYASDSEIDPNMGKLYYQTADGVTLLAEVTEENGEDIQAVDIEFM